MARDRCNRCGGPLSTQGTCYKLACVPEGPHSVRGKGAFHSNLNAVQAGRKAKTMCPLCVEAKCWPSVCHNGPNRRQCDCHWKIGKRSLGNEALFVNRLSPSLHVRHF